MDFLMDFLVELLEPILELIMGIGTKNSKKSKIARIIRITLIILIVAGLSSLFTAIAFKSESVIVRVFCVLLIMGLLALGSSLVANFKNQK